MVTVRSILGQGAVQCAVIEKDLRFLPSLRLLGFAPASHHAWNRFLHSREASGGRLVVHTGDVLSFNMCRFYYSLTCFFHPPFWARLFPDVLRKGWNEGIPNVRVLGNLPFNVSTPLIIR